MRRVRCYECGKAYDYDDDGFCPNCGSFNIAPKASRVDRDGTVIRDGIKETGHANSFLHQEYHEESRQRRLLGLDRKQKKVPRPVTASAARTTGAKAAPAPGSLVKWIVTAVVVLNILRLLFQ